MAEQKFKCERTDGESDFSTRFYTPVINEVSVSEPSVNKSILLIMLNELLGGQTAKFEENFLFNR